VLPIKKLFFDLFNSIFDLNFSCKKDWFNFSFQFTEFDVLYKRKL